MAIRRIYNPVQDRWRAYDCEALEWKSNCIPMTHPKIGSYSRYRHILKAWNRYWKDQGAVSAEVKMERAERTVI